jgi:transcriptional regulator GlxA family with amidase domain
MDCARGEALCGKIISALGVAPSTDLSKELDPRVRTAIEVMDEKVRDRATADELKVEEIRREVDDRLVQAKKPCGLGEAFKDSVDVTMGHYKVGLRLREALTEINPDAVVRRLAVKFGLFDGPALSNVFYDWLGIRPNEIKKQSYFRRCQ